MRKQALFYAFSTENSSFWANFPQNLFSKNDRKTVGKKPPTEISDESDAYDLKKSEKHFRLGPL